MPYFTQSPTTGWNIITTAPESWGRNRFSPEQALQCHVEHYSPCAEAVWHTVKYFLRWPQISTEVGQFPLQLQAHKNFRGWDAVVIFHRIINTHYSWYVWRMDHSFPSVHLPPILYHLRSVTHAGCWLSYFFFFPLGVTQLIGRNIDNTSGKNITTLLFSTHM